MGSKNHTLDNVIFFSIIALILLGGIVAFSMAIYDANDASNESISQGWELQIGTDDPYHDVNIETFKLPRDVRAGETVTLSKEIPDTIIRNETMRIYARQSAVRVEIGGRELYSYGMDLIEKGMYVGSGYHFVDLPSTNGATRIEIFLVSSEYGGLNSLPTVSISSYDDAYSTFIGGHIFTVFTSVFLFVLGVALSVVSLLYLTLDTDYFILVMIGFVSMLMGLWQLLSVGVLQIFAVDITLMDALEYLIMYFIPVPITLHAIAMRRRRKESVMAMQIMSVISFVFAVSAVLLHVFNVVHAVKLNPIFEIISIITIVFIILGESRGQRNLTISGKTYRIAVIMLSTIAIIDMIRFQISVLFFPEVHALQLSLMPIGLLMFVALLLYAYLTDLSTKLLREAQRDALKRLAYTDQLTGLSNRARSTLIFKELDETDEPYAIINMDLNGLKITNDTYGHSQGDQLICAFADLIRRLFKGIGECIRMSGDEFIITLTGDDNIRKAKERLNDLPGEEKKESRNYPFEIDASYGMAESSEADKPYAEEVYRMADRRMYDMKVRTKKGRQD